MLMMWLFSTTAVMGLNSYRIRDVHEKLHPSVALISNEIDSSKAFLIFTCTMQLYLQKNTNNMEFSKNKIF